MSENDRIIQIETNMKSEEEQQNQEINKSN